MHRVIDPFGASFRRARGASIHRFIDSSIKSFVRSIRVYVCVCVRVRASCTAGAWPVTGTET
eukprot:6747884-Alexandrium_andersonii.AAC.1